ncbi:hypothetical protein BpHYR1_013808 [Brachionus plicatilis]|uniref:Uncharacterized protein n=1 Tax=Brachionus plicatilis TaxID=10195 RepID=A0A3M7SWS5_BRAPC|nr:hypothetical protein BpHYR1_013808 [Brachionus plicatilis]
MLWIWTVELVSNSSPNSLTNFAELVDSLNMLEISKWFRNVWVVEPGMRKSRQFLMVQACLKSSMSSELTRLAWPHFSMSILGLSFDLVVSLLILLKLFLYNLNSVMRQKSSDFRSLSQLSRFFIWKKFSLRSLANTSFILSFRSENFIFTNSSYSDLASCSIVLKICWSKCSDLAMPNKAAFTSTWFKSLFDLVISNLHAELLTK